MSSDPPSFKAWSGMPIAGSVRLWYIALGVGLAAAAIYVLLPYGLLAGGLYVLATLAAAVTVASAALRRNDSFTPSACSLIAAALALAGIGHGIWYALDWVGKTSFPSMADTFHLAVYPLLIWALWVIDRHRPANEETLVDALIIGVSAAVVGWVWLVRPYVYDPSLSWPQLLIATAYPVADLMMVPFVLRLLFETRTRVSAAALMFLGILAYLAADLLYAQGNSSGWYRPGGLTDGLWLVAYTMFAAAAWHPAPASQYPDSGYPVIRPETRILALGITSTVIPLVILLTAGQDVMTVRIAAAGAVITSILVIYRLHRLVRVIGRQTALLEVLSQTDALTGAANRRYLNQVLEREVARCERTSASLSVAFLDLDHFKAYNDTRGHEAGDRLLIQAVNAWRREMRPMDLLARLGGEEFLIVLPDSDARQSQITVERLRSLVPEGQTCSAGVAAFQPGDTVASLIARADKAVYRAKRRGRDQTATAVEQPGQASATR